MADDEDNPYVKIRTYPCDICGRQFKQESLSKHRNVCEKVIKPRKIFDSGRQRADGSDVIYSKTKETRKVQIEGEKPLVLKYEDTSKNNWREKHTSFIKSIRQARGVTEAIRTGAPLPKFEPSAVPSDYVNCQFCNRNFNRNAAERHIPFCEAQSKRTKKTNTSNSASNQKQTPNRNNRAPLPSQQQQRKQSSDPYGNDYGSSAKGYQSGSTGSLGRGGVSGPGGSGNGRRPVKYESQYYYESDAPDSAGGGYSAKNTNKNQNNNNSRAANARQADQLLRTGRNVTNSELNALARNRSGNSQKESPKNSRRGGAPQQQQQQQQQQSQNGPRVTYTRPPQAPPQQESAGGKFCHDCGSEFPVQWARFCSFCGCGRL